MKGLCLSGGGIKAAAQIGALKAFEEKNIKFDCVSGSSAGSIIATLYALGYSSDEMFDFLKKYCKKIKFIDFKNIFKIIFGLIFQGKITVDGLNSGKVISKLVTDICNKKGIDSISQINMPLLIPSVDLQTGTVLVASSIKVNNSYELRNSSYSDKTIFVNDIPVGIAVQSSCSYPAVFSPCKYKGKQFVDGGIRENLPWKELKHIGADEVIGINFSTDINKDDVFKNMIEVASRSLDLVCHELSLYEIDGIDFLITIPFKKISLLDSSQIYDLYDAGYNFTKKKLKETYI